MSTLNGLVGIEFDLAVLVSSTLVSPERAGLIHGFADRHGVARPATPTVPSSLETTDNHYRPEHAHGPDGAVSHVPALASSGEVKWSRPVCPTEAIFPMGLGAATVVVESGTLRTSISELHNRIAAVRLQADQELAEN